MDDNIDDIMARWTAQQDQLRSEQEEIAKMIGGYRNALVDQDFSVEAAEQMAIDYHSILMTNSLFQQQQGQPEPPPVDGWDQLDEEDEV